MILHHGTTGHLGASNLTDGLCLAYEFEDSDAYLHGDTGRIYEIELQTGAQIADEDELAEAAAKLGVTWEEWGGLFHAADQPQVRAQLAADGFHAVRYTDQVAEGDCDGDTIRLLVPGVAHIIGVTEIEGK